MLEHDYPVTSSREPDPEQGRGISTVEIVKYGESGLWSGEQELDVPLFHSLVADGIFVQNSLYLRNSFPVTCPLCVLQHL